MMSHKLDPSVDLPIEDHSNSMPLSRSEAIKEYVEMLVVDENGFLVRGDEKSAGQFLVDYHKVCHSMRKRLVETVVQEKFGSTFLRIFRLLDSKGKLEDRQVTISNCFTYFCFSYVLDI
jgi:DNA-directed RNA polymerase III subunit RPC3